MASEGTSGCHKRPRKNEGLRYTAVALITLIALVVQTAGGHLSGSIALFADSVHVALDLVSAVLALVIVLKVTNPHAGHRLEETGTRISATLLLVGLAIITWHAFERLASPVAIEGRLAFQAALVGGVLNLLQIRLLLGGLDRSIRKAQMLHAMNDFASSIAVCIGLWMTWQFGIERADALASLVAVALVGYHAVPLALGKPHHH